MTEALKVEEKPQQKTAAIPQISLARIMVATDFSPYAERALDYAVSLARRFGSRIYLTHVITYEGHGVLEPDLGTPARERFRDLAVQNVQALEDSGRFFGVPHESVIEEGTLWPALEILIEKYKIDLLVLGTHGISGPLKAVFGSAAEQIFRQARVPVMTVGPAVTQEPPFEAEFRTILFATDFGPAAEREAAFAFAIAQENRARLLFLNVTPFKAGLPEWDAVAERSLITRQLQELVPRTQELHCKLEINVAYGEPVAEILRVARETKTDLIVIGAKRRGTLSGHIPGTKAYGVVRGAQCPVLTIKS
jgi:nucleotide-binding universal stress UspA family protein